VQLNCVNFVPSPIKSTSSIKARHTSHEAAGKLAPDGTLNLLRHSSWQTGRKFQHLIIMIRPKAVPNTDAAPSGWRAVGYN